jgi:hypothetical protein
MERHCQQCTKPFTFDNHDEEFLSRLSPSVGGRMYMLPPPSRCPQCRLRTRLAYRNQLHLYNSRSSLSGKPIFSMFPENAAFPVYSREEWWGDGWDAGAFGRDYDFSRPFFEQFLPLRDTVPAFALSALNPENSDYCNNVTEVKNCYLVFNTGGAEDCMCSEQVFKSRDCMDCLQTNESELCYDCVECAHCYAVQSSAFCENCRDSCFLLHCLGCRSCFGCVNLRQKEYCIFNEQKTKGEYQEFLTSLTLCSFGQREQWRQKACEFFCQHPRPHIESRQTEKVTGNLIFEARNVLESFLVRGAEDSKYLFSTIHGVKCCYDYTCFGNVAEYLYNCSGCGSSAFNLRCSVFCWGGSSDLDYCWMCVDCKDCFGCVGLRKKRHCILNKQYSRSEYELLASRIIENMQQTSEWGEFFPLQMSPFPYNHSYAQRLFPLTKREAEKERLSWHEKESLERKDVIPASELPDALPGSDTSLIVQSSGSTLFRITSEEIKFCRRLNVPLPRTSYDQRMEKLFKEFGGINLHQRRCPRTGRLLQTTYGPESGWIVWDRGEYEQEYSG